MAETPEDGFVELDPHQPRLNTDQEGKMKAWRTKNSLTRGNDSSLRRIEPSTRNSIGTALSEIH